MSALEDEILRLRRSERQLNQISNDWKRCSIALIGQSTNTPLQDHWIRQIRPGSFLWLVINESAPGRPRYFHIASTPAPYFEWINISPTLELFDSLTRELLSNFHENVAPTLDITESPGNGYAKHILPLSLESDMVRNAILAVSASQMQANRKVMALRSLEYRSAALRELQRCPQKRSADTSATLMALATILALLIDDMISESKDLAALVRLADSWNIMNPSNNDRSHESLREFMLDQIQMMKTLVHPLYKFTKSYGQTKKATASKVSTHLPLSHSKLYGVFEMLESATSQACSIHGYWAYSTPTENALEPAATVTDLDVLLDNLQSTVSGIPPFAPGENSLIWVYSIAVSRSTRPKHCAFFTSRLAELSGWFSINSYR
ncbi:hypothetical protein F5884DRAFT_742713 [Xylogone sp. PMI_703]|nr:hypothetical protein F5884DRAFT_742713 [Xylogone sp. PMI_703]